MGCFFVHSFLSRTHLRVKIILLLVENSPAFMLIGVFSSISIKLFCACSAFVRKPIKYKIEFYAYAEQHAHKNIKWVLSICLKTARKKYLSHFRAIFYIKKKLKCFFSTNFLFWPTWASVQANSWRRISSKRFCKRKHAVHTQDLTAKEAQAPSLSRPSKIKISGALLKGLSHEMDLTFDDMYSSFKA